MPRHVPIETRFLVLRKTPYSETSLVVAGLSPDHGQLHFLVRGARRLGPRAFPALDLFHLLRVTYAPPLKGTLCSWRAADLEVAYGDVAQSTATYTAAGWLARFALLNSTGEAGMPRFFTAVTVALDRLAQAATDPLADRSAACSAAVVGTVLIFLDENGLLADYRNRPAQRARRDLILDMAAGRQAPPKLDPDDWQRLRQWSVKLAEHNDCRLPDTR